MSQATRREPALAYTGPASPANAGNAPTASMPILPFKTGENRRALPTCASHIIEPLLSLDDLAVILKCSRRWIERERSAGRIPKPDIQLGKCPRWRVETIRRWIGRSGKL
jgi:hypothetical protein